MKPQCIFSRREMPKCVVRKCPHQTGKKSMYPEIVLHPFPKNIMLIQDWLRLAGMQEENLQIISLEILEDKRSDKFRMCSAHFTQDSYILKGSKRVLKVDARPSKFPEVSVLDFAHPPMMHRIARRARIEQSLALSAEGRSVQATCNCKCHARLKSRLVNSSTQTEASDFFILASVDPYFRLANHQHVGIDHGCSPTSEQELPTEDKAMPVKVPPSLQRIPAKWERTEFQLHQEKNQNENGFLSSKDTRSGVEEEMVTSEESSFDIITVEDWETAEVLIKQEDLQNENGLLHLGGTGSKKGSYTKDMPSCHTATNRKSGDYITGIKKYFIENGNGSLSLENPIHARVVPSFGKDPIKKKEGDRVKKEDPCKQSTSSLIEDSADEHFDATKPKRRKNVINANLQLLSDEEDTLPSTSPLSLEEKYAKEKKYVVFESCLDVLLLNMRCQQKYCSERIKQYDKHTVGSLLVVFATCCRGHNFKLWESQPRVNGVGAGNVLLATLLVLTGSSFAKIKGLCDIIALQIFSESSFHRYGDKYIFPSIDQWIQEEDEVVCKDMVLDRRRSV